MTVGIITYTLTKKPYCIYLKGKPHLKKVEHMLMEESKFNWCPVCSVQLSSLKQAFSHCMSKQHCERLLHQQGVEVYIPKRKVCYIYKYLKETFLLSQEK